DDCFDIVIDANDIQQNTTAQKLMKTLKLNDRLRGGDILPPIPTGVGYLPIPKPQRFYFSFGERISTAHVLSNEQDIWNVREQVAKSIEKQIVDLKQYRESDKDQNWSWLRKKLTNSFND
ncbi:MAG: hypothetical protein ACKOUU_14435, partial [Acinetobacter tjernbergiae]